MNEIEQGDERATRPHVICHMMAPVDGRLVVDDWAPSTGHTPEELIAVYDELHDAISADAWLSGRSTGEEFSAGTDGPMVPETDRNVEKPVHVAKQSTDEYAVLLDTHARLTWKAGEVYGSPLIVCLGSEVPDSHLAALASLGISYVVSPNPDLDLGYILEMLLQRFGVKRLLLEGGAHTNGTFLAAGMVDEISLVLFPGIGGKSGSPSIFEGGPSGLAGCGRLGLSSVEKAGLDSLHLRYRVVR